MTLPRAHSRKSRAFLSAGLVHADWVAAWMKMSVISSGLQRNGEWSDSILATFNGAPAASAFAIMASCVSGRMALSRAQETYVLGPRKCEAIVFVAVQVEKG